MRVRVPSALGIEVRNIAENHRFFCGCKFSDARFKHHDLAAHAFALEAYRGKSDLKAENLRNMYTDHKDDVPLHLSRRVASVLNYLHLVQNVIPGWIDRKWSFVDLYLVASQTAKSKLPSPKLFGKRYKHFEQKRRQNLANPEHLLKGSAEEKRMYKYIQAFQLSGGLLENIQKRNDVLRKRLLGVS